MSERALICEFYYWHQRPDPKQMDEYHARRLTLIEYLHVKAAMFDWHGVSDAANDLRVMEAEHLIRSQRTSGKYAPIIDELRERQSRC